MADDKLTPGAQAQAALDARLLAKTGNVGLQLPNTNETMPVAPVASTSALGVTLPVPSPMSSALAAQGAGALTPASTAGGVASNLAPVVLPGGGTNPIGATVLNNPTPSLAAAINSPSNYVDSGPTPEQQKQEVVNGPKTAAAGPIINGTPSAVSLNKRQEELMNTEAENQAPVTQAHYDIADELARARMVADEVTKQKNDMLTDHAQIMNKLTTNQQLHSDMATQSADQVAADIKSQIDGIPDVIHNPGVFTKTSNITKEDSGGQIGLKILGAIGQAAAMAGGAYGAGITHSRNFAMDIINEQIAKNVDAQKANIEKKWQAINVTHQLGNDQQLKYAHMLEQDNRNELAERYRVNDYLSYLQEKTGNQDAKTRLAELAAANSGKIADVQNNMAMQRKSFLDANYNQSVAQAAHAQSIAREETHRLEDRHDKYVEHAMSKAGGELSPDEAEARWSQMVNAGTIGGGPYHPFVPPPNMPTNSSVPTDLAVTDTNGNVRKSVSPEAQKATEPLMRAIRVAKGDADAYEKNPSQHNYDALVTSTGQVEGLKRASAVPGSTVWNYLKQVTGQSTGNTIADMVPAPAQMAVKKNALKDYKDMLSRHGEEIEKSAFGTPKIPFKKVQ